MKKRQDPLVAALKRRDLNALRRLAGQARTPRRRTLLLFLTDLIAAQVRASRSVPEIRQAG